MSEPGITDPRVEEAVAKQIAQCSTLTMNVAQRALVITEDRLELCLVKNIERIDARRGWLVPLGNVITLAAVLFTATFKSLILSAAVWEAIFWLLLIGSLVQLARSIYAAAKSLTTEELLHLLRIQGNQGSVGEAKKNDISQNFPVGPTPVSEPAKVRQALQCSVCGTLLPEGKAHQVCPTCGTMN